jgi:HEAT repeat protein
MGLGETRRRVRQLLKHGEHLPESLSAAILSEGSAAVAPLVALLQDKSLHGPVHAARLLLQLGAPEALEPLVSRLLRSEPGQLLHDTLLEGLARRGADVVPVTLKVLASTRDADARLGPLALLSRCGAKDERIYALLLEQLQRSPARGAMNLACYGDPRALEPLRRALDAQEVDEEVDDLFVTQAVIELEDAIHRLGGTLEEAQREKAGRAWRSLQRTGRLLRRILGALRSRRS